MAQCQILKTFSRKNKLCCHRKGSRYQTGAGSGVDIIGSSRLTEVKDVKSSNQKVVAVTSEGWSITTSSNWGNLEKQKFGEVVVQGGSPVKFFIELTVL